MMTIAMSPVFDVEINPSKTIKRYRILVVYAAGSYDVGLTS